MKETDTDKTFLGRVLILLLGSRETFHKFQDYSNKINITVLNSKVHKCFAINIMILFREENLLI